MEPVQNGQPNWHDSIKEMKREKSTNKTLKKKIQCRMLTNWDLSAGEEKTVK